MGNRFQAIVLDVLLAALLLMLVAGSVAAIVAMHQGHDVLGCGGGGSRSFGCASRGASAVIVGGTALAALVATIVARMRGR